MGATRTVVTGIVALAAGLGIGWVVAAGARGGIVTSYEERIETLRTEHADAKRGLEKQVADARTEARQARGAAETVEAKLKAAEADLATVRARLADAETRLAAGASGAAGSAPAPKPKATFAFEQFGDAFEKVDWASVAEHTTEIVGPLREIVDAIAAGQPVPLKAAGEAQKHNGPLIQAVGVIASSLSGTGPNGAYTHPAFQVNALAAALERIGKPLSASQRTALEEVGRRFTEEERARVASYDDRTFQMRKLVEEGDLKDRFFDEVRKVLSAEQLDALSPPSVRDRVAADLWSEGLLWATVMRPMNFTAVQEFNEPLTRTLGVSFKLDDAAREKVAAIVADWAKRLPQELVERDVDPLERMGMAPSDRVLLAAQETRRLVERIATDLTLGGDQLAAAQRWSVVFYPIPAAE